MKEAAGSITEQKKKISLTPEGNELKITVDSNLIKTFWMPSSTSHLEKFWPFKKSNNKPLHVDNMSNHPLSIKN